MASGYKGYTALWLGGASAVPGVVAGYRGLLAFWIGGAASYVETVVVPPSGGGGRGWYAPRRRVERPPEPRRQPVAYSVEIGCDKVRVRAGNISISIVRRPVEIKANTAHVSTRGASYHVVLRDLKIGSVSVDCEESAVRVVAKYHPPPPKPRQRFASSLRIGCDLASVRGRDVSFAIIRRPAVIEADAARTSTRGVLYRVVRRDLHIDISISVCRDGDLRAVVVRDPVPDRPLDTRVAGIFARRATPLDIDTLVMAMRREARRSPDTIRKLIRAAHVAAAAMGRGGIDKMRSGDWQRVDDAIAREQRLSRSVASRPAKLAAAIRETHNAAKTAIEAETAQ